MRPQARIRTARAADAAGIFELEQHFSSDRMSLRSVRGFLRSPSARVWIAVAPHASPPTPQVLAALILLTRRNSGVARIYSIVVAPQARGQGLARKLLRHAETAARAAGCHAASLEVREDNAGARALYLSSGYVETARLPRFYDDGADGVRLRKVLRISP